MHKIWDNLLEILKESDQKIEIGKCPNNKISLIFNFNINNTVLEEIVNNTMGICINNCVRILGNGDNISWQDIIEFNLQYKKIIDEQKILVANDIFGGLFCINGQELKENNETIWYFAPDLLEWMDLELNYFDFIKSISSANFEIFYKDFIWKSFYNELNNVKYNQGVFVYPFLWSKECEINSAEKNIISISEIISLNFKFMKDLNS